MAKFKKGDKVKVIAIRDVNPIESARCEGTIATIVSVSSCSGGHYDYNIVGEDKEGANYKWGVKESWIRALKGSESNNFGKFTKLKDPRKLAADPLLVVKWNPTPEW